MQIVQVSPSIDRRTAYMAVLSSFGYRKISHRKSFPNRRKIYDRKEVFAREPYEVHITSIYYVLIAYNIYSDLWR